MKFVLSTLVAPDAFEETSNLSKEWDDLFRRCSFSNPFVSYDWLSTWWRHFGADKELRIVTVRVETKQLVAIVPLCISL
jgi:CelD/BcsL family acetyltransferase involved in cellulose biosynthesis